MSIKHGLFAVNDRKAFVCTLRAARNMAFQGTITPPRGHIEQLVELDGAKVVGTKIKAPYAISPEDSMSYQ